MKVFSERLKLARQLRHMTQSELEKKAGIFRTSVAQFELGSRAPSLNSFAKLAKALNVSADYFLGISDVPEAVTSHTVMAKAINTLSLNDLEIMEGLVDILLKRNAGRVI